MVLPISRCVLKCWSHVPRRLTIQNSIQVIQHFGLYVSVSSTADIHHIGKKIIANYWRPLFISILYYFHFSSNFIGTQRVPSKYFACKNHSCLLYEPGNILFGFQSLLVLHNIYLLLKHRQIQPGIVHLEYAEHIYAWSTAVPSVSCNHSWTRLVVSCVELSRI